jgi:hypothetical protein
MSVKISVRSQEQHTAFHRALTARKLETTGAGMCAMRRDTMPASGSLFRNGFAENRSFIAVKYPGLTGRLFHCRSSCLISSQVSINNRLESSRTNVFVAKYVPFKLKLNLFNLLATVVGDVDIDVNAGPADPNLPVQASCNPNDFDSSITRFQPLIRSCERAR